MTDEQQKFEEWWYSPGLWKELTKDNPFRPGSPPFWAWEGWKGRAKLEKTK